MSNMSNEFYEWLDQCPVTWFRDEVTKDYVTYSFETPNEDEEKVNFSTTTSGELNYEQ